MGYCSSAVVTREDALHSKLRDAIIKERRRLARAKRERELNPLPEPIKPHRHSSLLLHDGNHSRRQPPKMKFSDCAELGLHYFPAKENSP